MIGAQWADQSAPAAADSFHFSGNKIIFFTTIITVWPTTEGPSWCCVIILDELFCFWFSSRRRENRTTCTQRPAPSSESPTGSSEKSLKHPTHGASHPSSPCVSFASNRLDANPLTLQYPTTAATASNPCASEFPSYRPDLYLHLASVVKSLFPGRWYLHLPPLLICQTTGQLFHSETAAKIKILTSGKAGHFSIFFLLFCFTWPAVIILYGSGLLWWSAASAVPPSTELTDFQIIFTRDDGHWPADGSSWRATLKVRRNKNSGIFVDFVEKWLPSIQLVASSIAKLLHDAL